MEENITSTLNGFCIYVFSPSICICLFTMFLLVCLYALLYNLPLMFYFFSYMFG